MRQSYTKGQTISSVEDKRRPTNGGERSNSSGGQCNSCYGVIEQREGVTQSLGTVLGSCEHKQVTSMQL